MTKERALFIGGCWDGRLCDVEPELLLWREVAWAPSPQYNSVAVSIARRSRYRRSVLMCESGRKEFKPTVFYIEESLSDFDAMTMLVTWYAPDKKDVS